MRLYGPTAFQLFGSTIEPGFQIFKGIGRIAVLPYSRSALRISDTDAGSDA